MRFTIVTPSFKQLDWLKLCIASVRDQVGAGSWHTANESGECRVMGDESKDEVASRLTVEHIIQDAGSEGIEEFAKEQGANFYRDGKEVFDSKCSVGGGSVPRYSLSIYSEKDAGMYDAINRGLIKGTGEICAYLNCDEQYLQGALQWVADYFSTSPKTDVLFGAAIVVRPDGSYVCDRRVMVPTRWHTMVSGNLSIFTSSTFFRRDAVVARGLLFDPRWKMVGDAAWVIRLLEARTKMAATKKPLSVFAETGGNLSTNSLAAGERLELARSAPALARALRSLIVCSYRLRRLFGGAYDIAPHTYAIYTMASSTERTRFVVENPRFRWQVEPV